MAKPEAYLAQWWSNKKRCSMHRNTHVSTMAFRNSRMGTIPQSIIRPLHPPQRSRYLWGKYYSENTSTRFLKNTSTALQMLLLWDFKAPQMEKKKFTQKLMLHSNPQPCSRNQGVHHKESNSLSLVHDRLVIFNRSTTKTVAAAQIKYALCRDGM